MSVTSAPKQSWLYKLEDDYTRDHGIDAASGHRRRRRARHHARCDGPASRLRGGASGAGGRGPRGERAELRPGLGERPEGRPGARPGTARPRAVGRTRRLGPRARLPGRGLAHAGYRPRRWPAATRCATTRPTTCRAGLSCRRRPPRPGGPAPSCCWSSGPTAGSPSATRTNTPSRSRSTSTRTPTTICAPGPRRCSAGPSHRCKDAGPASTVRWTPTWPVMHFTTGPRSSPALSWSPVQAGVA
jgi:hypothetical protein